MDNKVTSIKERLPQTATLPNGIYTGTWGGYVIIVNHDKRVFELTTEQGVRGININVVVEVKDGITTFDTIANK